jgi:hypothetical protein
MNLKKKNHKFDPFFSLIKIYVEKKRFFFLCEHFVTISILAFNFLVHQLPLQISPNMD